MALLIYFHLLEIFLYIQKRGHEKLYFFWLCLPAKNTRPRILVPLVNSPEIFQVYRFDPSLSTPPSIFLPSPGYVKTVLYCCMVAWTKFGGHRFLAKSSKVSTAVTLRDVPAWKNWKSKSICTLKKKNTNLEQHNERGEVSRKNWSPTLLFASLIY